MLEIKITVSCPDLANAITALADAVIHKVPGAPTPDPHQTGAPSPTETPINQLGIHSPSAVFAASLPAETPTNPTVPPVAMPATGTATPAPAPTSAPPAAPVAPLFAAPVSNAPAPMVPVASAPAYTLDQISRAGAALIDQGKMPQLIELLKKYGVQAVTQLDASAYPAFIEEMKALGAQL